MLSKAESQKSSQSALEQKPYLHQFHSVMYGPAEMTWEYEWIQINKWLSDSLCPLCLWINPGARDTH